MNERKLKLFFALLFLISFFSIVNHHSFYPSIRFPHFKNRHLGTEFTYSEVRVFSIEKGNEVDLMSVIQPYDKQYYFFLQKAVAHPEVSPRVMILLNKLYQQNCYPGDSLRLSVKTVSASVE